VSYYILSELNNINIQVWKANRL